jgi:hypothetical protein
MGLLAREYKCGAPSAVNAARDVCREYAFFGTIIVRRFFANVSILGNKSACFAASHSVH